MWLLCRGGDCPFFLTFPIKSKNLEPGFLTNFVTRQPRCSWIQGGGENDKAHVLGRSEVAADGFEKFGPETVHIAPDRIS